MKKKLVSIFFTVLGLVFLSVLPSDAFQISADCEGFTLMVETGTSGEYDLLLANGECLESDPESCISIKGSFNGTTTVNWSDVCIDGTCVNDLLESGDAFTLTGNTTIKLHDSDEVVTVQINPPLEISDCAFPATCRVTAGGNKDGFTEPCALKKNGTPDMNCAKHGPDRWGGEAGSPPRVDGNWTHQHKPGPHDMFVFHSNDLFDITCSDPGDFCEPARFAPNRQIDFSGIGRFNTRQGVYSAFPEGDVCFWVHLEDTGEPGPGSRKKDIPDTTQCTHCPGTVINNAEDCPNCTDYYMIEIYDSAANDGVNCTGTLIYTNGPGVPENCTEFGDPQLNGYFTDKGNIQLHPDNNGP
jgi:hypothetical protein